MFRRVNSRGKGLQRRRLGGSWFPTAGATAAAKRHDYDPAMLEAAAAIDDRQPERLLDPLERHVDPRDKRIAVLGLAFKPQTDDVRNSRATPVIEALQRNVADDPVGTENMKERVPDLEYATSAAEALQNAHGAVVGTDWEELAALEQEFQTMNQPIVVDDDSNTLEDAHSALIVTDWDEFATLEDAFRTVASPVVDDLEVTPHVTP